MMFIENKSGFRLRLRQNRRRLKSFVRGIIQPIKLTLVGRLAEYKRYLKQRRDFTRLGGHVDKTYIILKEFKAPAGISRGHYFHQDLLVASFIHARKPERHIDVGSRIDGFVAHIASFRPIEVFDLRPLSNAGHENIRFLQADFMDSNSATDGIADSVSSLHALEHFGLGRYGDQIDPQGHIKGFNNLVRLAKPGGFIYVSFPIGNRDEVHFNAHRVFNPRSVLSWVDRAMKINLVRFDYIDDLGDLHREADLDGPLPSFVYGCGIYTFQRALS